MAAILLRHQYWLAPQAPRRWPPVCWRWIKHAAPGRRGTTSAKECLRLKQTFSGYVSPEVLKEIMDGSLDARKVGVKGWCAQALTDIRNFTTISESVMAPEAVGC